MFQAKNDVKLTAQDLQTATQTRKTAGNKSSLFSNSNNSSFYKTTIQTTRHKATQLNIGGNLSIQAGTPPL